jgi:hypothetical protein
LTGFSETVKGQAVALGILAIPQTRADVIRLLQAIPDLSDSHVERRAHLAEWLHILYPGDEGRYITPLRPDELADEQLTSTEELVELTINIHRYATSPGEVAQLLATLIRAAHTYPSAHNALHNLLCSRLRELEKQAAMWSVNAIPSLLKEATEITGHN